ncbi:MAG: vWA domain-containing protein [Hyphomicrobium sp.]
MPKFAFSRTLVGALPSWRARFLSDAKGSILVPFAIMLSVALMSVGVAIDYGEMTRVRSQIAAAADAAALAGVSEARTNLLANLQSNGTQRGKILKAAEETTRTFFTTQVAELSAVAPEASIKLNLNKRKITSTLDYSATYRPHVMSIFGFSTMPISGTAETAAETVPYMEVTLVVDTSGSMAIGADAAQQTLLRNKLGCAFACHDGNPVAGYADAYAYALGNGIKLRYQVINEGINALINEFDRLDPDSEAVKAAIWSFDTDHHINQAQTSNRSKLRMHLPSAPATSGETEGATKFNEAIGHIMQTVGKGGDGSVPGHPIKVVIVATDGAQDPGRFWTSNVPYRQYVAPIDTAFCTELKEANVKVGILHTPYAEMSYDWGYNATLGQPSQLGGPGTRADDIPIVLKACAGDLYLEASNSSKIASGFVSIFRAAGMPRVTH